MATLALLTRQRMLACSLRLFGGRHTHCLAALPRITTSNSKFTGGTASHHHNLVPLQLLRHNHKTTTSTTSASIPPSDDEKDVKTVPSSSDLFGDAANMSLVSKFKQMYKQYWYVLIPVHVATSLGWFGGFYYLSMSGVDVPAVLQYLHLSETIIGKVQSSHMGHYAVAYLCYKLATPLRYALTLGCTTVSIKHLVQHGYIKPIPTKKQLIKMYEDKKANRASAKADKEEKDESK